MVRFGFFAFLFMVNIFKTPGIQDSGLLYFQRNKK